MCPVPSRVCLRTRKDMTSHYFRGSIGHDSMVEAIFRHANIAFKFPKICVRPMYCSVEKRRASGNAQARVATVMTTAQIGVLAGAVVMRMRALLDLRGSFVF